MNKLIVLLSICLVSLSIQAERSRDYSTDLQLSLTPDFALHNKKTRITGLSLGVWSENPQSFMSFALFNGSTRKSKGLSIGVVNYTRDYTGLQLGLYNYSSKKFKGTQFGFVNQVKSISGMQLGIVNYCSNLEKGFQLGLFNINSREAYDGVQTKGPGFMPIFNMNF